MLSNENREQLIKKAQAQPLKEEEILKNYFARPLPPQPVEVSIVVKILLSTLSGLLIIFSMLLFW